MILESSAVQVKNALRAVRGVTEITVSFQDATVAFFYDPAQVQLKEILKAVRNAGFLASEKPSDAPAKGTAAVSQKTSLENRPGAMIRKTLKIDGMTCASCSLRIENRLKKAQGVLDARASFSNGTAQVGYDPRQISLTKIVEIIEKLGYRVVNQPGRPGASADAGKKRFHAKTVNQFIGIGIILLAGYLIIKNTAVFSFLPNISQNMGYGILFVVGLITSLHCVAMCGGINLSQTVSTHSEASCTGAWARLKPGVLYNAGRVISYTVLGGLVGALGSVFSFSGTAKGAVTIIAGVFMVLMGLNMLNIFPWLRKITPHMPKFFGRKLFAGSGGHGPFYIGLLNGLMPCGPLQAMQIYALGTGSPVKGALSMLVFSLGTVPLMFGLSAVSSFLSGKFTHKMMKVSAALVMILGIAMLGRGFSLAGINFAGAISPKAAASGSVAVVQGNGQTVTTQLQANKYTPITVQKGIPVKWVIRADVSNINGCNQTVTIPQYNIQKTLQPGDNEIEFTPQQTGNITYTCSMGMLTSTISVVDSVANAAAAPAATAPSAQQPSGTGGQSDVGVATISGNEQDVTVTVGTAGYSPAILVLQKGVPAKIKFKATQLTSCNSTVVFPELNGQINLQSQTETPLFTPQSDLSFQCGMGMLQGYIKVVDDIHKIDLNAIRQEAQNKVSAGGGMACCQ